MSMCCLDGKPCFIERCSKCPDRGADFKTWLEPYKPGDVFDRGDMAACWYAAQRSYRARFVVQAAQNAAGQLRDTKPLARHLRGNI